MIVRARSLASVLIIGVLASACGEQQESPKVTLEERYSGLMGSERKDLLFQDIDDCKKSKETSVAYCVGTSVGNFRYRLDRYDVSRGLPKVPRAVQLYLSQLTLAALNEKDYKTADLLLEHIEVGAFTQENTKHISKLIGEYKPQYHGIYNDLLMHLANSGELFDVYEKLVSWAVADLDNPGYARGASNLRGYLMHYGCMKTAEVWKEINPGNGSSIPQGGSHHEIPLAESDMAEITQQRIALRRDRVIPALQENCPINLAK